MIDDDETAERDGTLVGVGLPVEREAGGEDDETAHPRKSGTEGPRRRGSGSGFGRGRFRRDWEHEPTHEREGEKERERLCRAERD